MVLLILYGYHKKNTTSLGIYINEQNVEMFTERNKLKWLTGSRARQSSSQRSVRSTEVLFLFSGTQAGTSSARLAQRLGFWEDISSMYFAGLIWRQKYWIVLTCPTEQEMNPSQLHVYMSTTRGSLERSSKLVGTITLRKALNTIPRWCYKDMIMQSQHLMQPSNIQNTKRRWAIITANQNLVKQHYNKNSWPENTSKIILYIGEFNKEYSPSLCFFHRFLTSKVKIRA